MGTLWNKEGVKLGFVEFRCLFAVFLMSEMVTTFTSSITSS